MNILVCILRVPDTATKINLGSNGRSIDTKGVKFVMNPYDDFAVEEALLTKKKFGGTVTVAAVGDEEHIDVLRNCLAMGADKAVHIKGEDYPFDAIYMAKNFAAYAEKNNFDIIFTGKQSVDFDSYQLGGLIGEMLDIPSISVVTKLDITDTTVTAERDIEGGKEVVETTLPCVITTQKGLNTPRYPKLPDIMKAKKKPIEEIEALEADPTISILSIEKPVRERANKIFGDSEADIDLVVKLLKEDAKVI